MVRVSSRCSGIVVVSLVGLLGFGITSCRQKESSDSRPTTRAAVGSPSTKPAKAFAEIPDHHLHNAHRVTDKVISGAQPEDAEAFAALQKLGVKTVISVDGAKPDVELAKKYGMRYVHLPIGYNEVGKERGEELAKAMEELPGPVYVHCHHGKHRSAAAVAVGCVLNGSLKAEKAEAVLKTFGTGENYVGLWRDAREARPMNRERLAEKKVAYVEAAKIGDLAEAMVGVDHAWDNLKLLQEAGWGPLASHPDLSAKHEALQLTEHFLEIWRTDDTKKRPEPFRTALKESEASARELQSALTATPLDKLKAEAAFKRGAAACAACHKAYRD